MALDEEFDLRLRALGTAAREAGFDPRITSGYRSGFDQARAINSVAQNVLGRPAGILDYARGIPGYAAPVGGSQHEKGFAADWGTGPALDWLRQNAPRYGVRFPESLSKTDPVHSELDSKFYGPVQDPRNREDQTVAAFDTQQPQRMALGNPPAQASAAPASTGAPRMADPYQPQPRGGFLGLLDSLQSGVQSPLFQSGAAMYSAASQGKDIGTGFLMGGEAAGRAAKSQAEMAKMQRETMAQQQRDQMWGQLMSGQTPAWAAALPTGTLDLARALGPDAGASLIANMLGKNSERLIERDKLNEAKRYHDALMLDSSAKLEENRSLNADRRMNWQAEREKLQQQLREAERKERMRQELFGGAPTTAPQPPVAPVIPQSNEIEPNDPNLIRTQAAAPAPQPAPVAPAAPAQAAPAMVPTPRGPMPPDQARAFGQKMLMDPEFRALGQDIIKQADELTSKGKLGQTAQNENEKSLLGDVHHLARLNDLEQKVKAEYLQLGPRLTNSIKGVAEFAGVPLKPEDQESLAKFAAFRRSTAANFNLLLKEASGTAVTESELKRMVLQEPTAEWNGMLSPPDSPTQFMAKLQAAKADLIKAIARKNYMRTTMNLSDADIATLAKGDSMPVHLDNMKKIMDETQRKVERDLKIKYPNAEPEQLQPLIRQGMQKVFGI